MHKRPLYIGALNVKVQQIKLSDSFFRFSQHFYHFYVRIYDKQICCVCICSDSFIQTVSGQRFLLPVPFLRKVVGTCPRGWSPLILFGCVSRSREELHFILSLGRSSASHSHQSGCRNPKALFPLCDT